jgi:hypothetical protein
MFGNYVTDKAAGRAEITEVIVPKVMETPSPMPTQRTQIVVSLKRFDSVTGEPRSEKQHYVLEDLREQKARLLDQIAGIDTIIADAEAQMVTK